MSRKSKWIRRLAYALLALGAAFGVSASLKPEPIPVQVGRAVRGPLRVTVEALGRTRLIGRDTLAAPAAGELSKISLRAGDRVEAGQLVAEILPGAPSPLDARTKAEIMARLGASQASRAEAQRAVERAEIAVNLADKEAARSRELHARGAIAPGMLERSDSEANARRSELELAKASVERIRRESSVVAAPLRDPNRSGTKGTQRVEVRAPESGVVLRVHQESAGPVQPGTPLLDLGDPSSMEFIVDLPTQSATKVQPGAPVRIDGAGNGAVLSGKVKLVEPAAFTKVTALGVEEQRVNVVVTPDGDTKLWSTLGDGFAADASIEIQKAEDVLKVPLGAVFRDQGQSAVFCLGRNRARLVHVKTGSRSAAEVEILNGISAGTPVVVHPSDKVTDGVIVRVE